MTSVYFSVVPISSWCGMSWYVTGVVERSLVSAIDGKHRRWWSARTDWDGNGHVDLALCGHTAESPVLLSNCTVGDACCVT
jgi:hypothetical protein